MGAPARESRRGRSGTGKSRFVEALAHVAIEKDLRVAWFTLEYDAAFDWSPDYPRRFCCIKHSSRWTTPSLPAEIDVKL